MFFRPVTKTPHQRAISHPTAVLIIASVATVWGFGFPMTRVVLDGGLPRGRANEHPFDIREFQADLLVVRYGYGKGYGVLQGPNRNTEAGSGCSQSRRGLKAHAGSS